MRAGRVTLGVALAVGACGTAPEPVVIEPDGGWCWFQDERAIVVGDELLVGSVASGRAGPERRGDVQVTRFDLRTGERATVELHNRLQVDDHDAPALLAFDDGTLLAVYTKHGNDDLVRWRRGRVDDLTHWEPEQTMDAVRERGLGATYSNVFLLRDADGERVLDFHRGDGWDPNVLVSRDRGASFAPAGRLLDGPGRPYVTYASDGRVVHFVCTEQHPRDFDNSLYHGVLAGERILRSDGEPVGHLRSAPAQPEALTRVFAGRPDAVAWPCDLELDGRGQPVALFTVQRDGAGLPKGRGGLDHRFGYARFDGGRWHVHEIAHAGTRLYAGEDDYTGLAAIDPDDVDVVFVSTDADPVTGAPLVSGADGLRHREIFRGMTADGGATWRWTAITRDSRADNLRPIVPRRARGRTALLWLRGELRSYTDYDLEIVALPLPVRSAGG